MKLKIIFSSFPIIEDMKEENKTPVKKIYGFFMSLFYFGIGCALSFTTVLENIIPVGVPRIIGGVLLIVYGLFRAYRAWKE
ncbi:MAG: hypothetical protein ACK5KN_10300 [Dysgonomonas sp.]|nr:hypothetical protein [Prevotella sp.]